MNDKDAIEQFEHFQQIVKAIRRYRADHKIPPKVKLPAIIVLDPRYRPLLQMRDAFIYMANLDSDTFGLFVEVKHD